MDDRYKHLDIYYIVDTGTQMHGDKIGSVNSAMEEAITVDIPDISSANDDIKIRVAIMQFSSGASWVTTPVSVDEIIWRDLHAGGANDFGHALNLLALQFKKEEAITDLAPVIIAFSNATATDDYETAFDKLCQIPLFRDSIRIGVAIGEDADRHALTLFTGDSKSVLAVNDKYKLKALIRIQHRKEKRLT